MCGIAGILTGGAVDDALVAALTQPIAHRGPDGQGIWTDPQMGIGLGHRRLSIIELSPLGHQPMASNDARYVLSFNGEIYNHLHIRKELEAAAGGGINWRGHSDTETLVEAVARWGLEKALQKSVGMFALALWDKKERRLLLARDRFGEKPLYYGWSGGDFVFASELKAIRGHPRFANDIDRRAVRLLAARAYIPAPLSIYRRIYKLDPGCILSLGADAWQHPLDTPLTPGESVSNMRLQRYWSYGDVVRHGLSEPIIDEDDALEQLEATLAKAIGGQAVADVPVGAFLSGGIDSSTVVGLYRKYSRGTVRTFSIGFEEEAFNEADHAKAVARHFGTEHQERYVSVKETQDVIPLLPRMYDEPFADSSQIPTHLVSRFAREQVTVALSGDGGDELFGGYNRHFMAPRLWQRLSKVPQPLRSLVGRPLSRLPATIWNGVARAVPGLERRPHFGTKVQKGLRLAGSARGLEDIYNSFLDPWSFGTSPVLGSEAAAVDLKFDMDVSPEASDAVRMMYSDAITYLPDDILCKVDRAAMAVSLETRVPFLDHRVAELAARIPASMKIRNGKGKHILRRLLYREAPQRLFERPKAGFGIPVGEWIRGPMRPWAEDLLDRARLQQEGLFDADVVHRRWRQHLKRESDATPELWAVLMYQAWARENAAS